MNRRPTTWPRGTLDEAPCYGNLDHVTELWPRSAAVRVIVMHRVNFAADNEEAGRALVGLNAICVPAFDPAAPDTVIAHEIGHIAHGSQGHCSGNYPTCSLMNKPAGAVPTQQDCDAVREWAADKALTFAQP